jgi:urease accessory protein
MLTLTSVLARSESAEAVASVTLSCDQRRRARLRARLDDGTEVGLVLPRGLALKDGDRLRSEDGTIVVLVRAAVEELSCASTDDPHLLLRAAYHLGNRHVALQLDPRQLRYQHDHVLDALMRELGLTVTALKAQFEPEPGAYGHEEPAARAGHHHSHDHGHQH